MKVREMLTPLAATVSKNRKEKKRNNDTLTNVIFKKKTLLMVKTQIGCRLSSSSFPGEAKRALEREIKGQIMTKVVE